ncbi:hypothetical protein BGZ61DRAFT_455241 [Ilyonectria robusta]|uniref:uncharacterized protein n=1 Tax=Ilyonectria robusta TaxID=1079257 RepID=UPI001E8E91A5|nr:uncharacterized protein BGZ61DRAFT_455241 [Ilyonectria robusta]KAH8685294.1 hypothetical protein BGZ61DRAFT_455241 [Ilyonectria robusta]
MAASHYLPLCAVWLLFFSFSSSWRFWYLRCLRSHVAVLIPPQNWMCSLSILIPPPQSTLGDVHLHVSSVSVKNGSQTLWLPDLGP